MQSNKLRVIVLIAVIALITVGAILCFLHPEWFTTSVTKTKESEQAWRAGEELKVSRVIKVGDIAACDAVNYTSADGIDYKTVCRNNIALRKLDETKDYGWCDKLDGILIPNKDCKLKLLLSKIGPNPTRDQCASAPDEETKNTCLQIAK